MGNPRAAQLVEAGMWLRLSGDHEGATRLFHQALKLDPDNARARQLLDAEPNIASPPSPPVLPPRQSQALQPPNPFAPVATSTAMDHDWGTATGFSHTQISTRSAPELRPSAPTAPFEVPIDFDLPVELEIDSLPPNGFDEEPRSTPSSKGQSNEIPPPAPTVPEHRAQDTLEFARPGAATTSDEDWGGLFASPLPGAVPIAPPPSEPKFAPNATSAWDQRSNPGIQLTEGDPGMSAALDLVSADRPSSSVPVVKGKLDEFRTLVRGAKDLLGLDDHTGAMDLILKAQELAPNDPEVHALRSRSETTLEAMFESKLGTLSSAPRVKLKDDEIIWLNLDHRAGFVLAQIDGQVSFEDLFSVSGMSRLDTARILAQLIEEGVIAS